MDTSCETAKTTITEEISSEYLDGHHVKRYKLTNSASKIQLELLSYGGTITSIKVPDKTGKLVDVVLGFDDIEGYKKNPYFGAVVGRYGNRIKDSKFTYKGVTHHLIPNEGDNHLHGGPVGWSKVYWESKIEDDCVVLSYFSIGGEQGYPGNVQASVKYRLTNDGEVEITYSATADQTTPVNMSIHPYYNLEGEGSGAIHNHKFMINAERYLPVAEGLIPTGEKKKVDGTPFDLRKPTLLSDALKQMPEGGYMHTYCVNGAPGKKHVAKVSAPKSGIVMDVFTDQPGLIFYTGEYLNVGGGKNKHIYPKHTGFLLDTKNYPNAPNQENFPDPFLNPESEYQHKVWYKFSTNKK